MINVILTSHVNTVPFTEHRCCINCILKEGWLGRSTTQSKRESPFSRLHKWSMSICPLWKYHKQALYLCNGGKTTFQTLALAFYFFFSFFQLFFLCSAYIHYQIPSFEATGNFKPLNSWWSLTGFPLANAASSNTNKPNFQGLLGQNKEDCEVTRLVFN